MPRLTIELYDLLSPGVGHASEDARFGDGRIIFVAQNSGDGNSLVAEASQEQSAGLIVTYNPNGQHIDAEICEIVHGVCAASGKDSAFAMAEDEHRSFAGHTRDFAEYEFIGDHVTKNGDGHARKALHDLGQAIRFSWGLAHVQTNSLMERACGCQSDGKLYSKHRRDCPVAFERGRLRLGLASRSAVLS